MKNILVTLALGSSLVCQGQYSPVGAIAMWTKGYVVTVDNDTLQGQLRVGSSINDSPAAIILKTADEKKIKLKADDLQLIAQRIPAFAYSTGGIPRDREFVVFERVPNPRRAGRWMLLERLTPSGGRLALYFDASGVKKTTEYSFGNFTLSDQQELSYIVLKNKHESWVVKRGEMEAVHELLFGDCPTFMGNYPTATRRDWDRFGKMVSAYNRLCQQP